MQGRSERGGWTKDQLALLGVTWPPEAGWIYRVMGDQITEEAARAFLQRPTSRLPAGRGGAGPCPGGRVLTTTPLQEPTDPNRSA